MLKLYDVFVQNRFKKEDKKKFKKLIILVFILRFIKMLKDEHKKHNRQLYYFLPYVLPNGCFKMRLYCFEKMDLNTPEER